MKSLKDTQRSCSSRLNRARRNAIALASMVEKKDTRSADFWCELRSLAETISQCVHEANAYNNVAMGGMSFSDDLHAVSLQTPIERAATMTATPEASE